MLEEPCDETPESSRKKHAGDSSSKENSSNPQRRILGLVSEDLLVEVKRLSSSMGIQQQQFVADAIAYFVQLKGELLQAELLMGQLATRQRVHPDSLRVAAMRQYLEAHLGEPSLSDLATEELLDSHQDIAELDN